MKTEYCLPFNFVSFIDIIYKMRKSVLIFLSVLIPISFCFAQQPDQLLRQWAEKNSIEKVWLHFDRDNYLAGETAWFKAYLYADYQPDTISTTLYVELLNNKGFLIDRKVLPILDGRTFGQFELNDSLSTDNYLIRAYSPTMLNGAPGQDSAYIFQKNIFVLGKNTKTQTFKKITDFSRIEFFPESGNFVNGIMNTIAFKATDEEGKPIAINGLVKNDKDEIVAEFASVHDGMGMFDITPISGVKYYAIIKDDARAKEFPLPSVADEGVVLRILQSGKNKFYEIEQRSNQEIRRAAYIVGQMQNHIVFKNNFSTEQNKTVINGPLDVSHLASGILQVTVFNKDNIPLAERLCFVNNGEYKIKADIEPDTLSFKERSRNVLRVAFKDTVVGSFSMSVVDPAYSNYAPRSENIYSSLLLTSDLHGYIHNPAYYFLNDDDSTQANLDLVMMTNGWRRFKWTELSKGISALPAINDPGYIRVAGKVNIMYLKKMFVSKPFLVFINTQDHNKSMRMGLTDAQGNFQLDSLMFFGNALMSFKDIRGKKSSKLEVKLSADTLTRNFSLPKFSQELKAIGWQPSTESKIKLEDDLDAINKAKGIMLNNVTVKVKKKSAEELLDEKYSKGMFSGFAERTIDLVHTDEPIFQSNIFDYLQGRVPGLNISNDGPEYSIHYRQAATTSSMGLIPMILYLDEVQTDVSFISAIPANDIAMVKVFSNFVGAEGNGAGGVLAIYTKKGEDALNSITTKDRIRYQGYSVIKEFYAPDYKVNQQTDLNVDNRITLLWKPDIQVRGINSIITIPFYNNDRSKQFKVVLEGLTVDGKMLMLEKIFDKKE